MGIYALKEYAEEPKLELIQKERMNPYIEGICLEVGNFEGFLAYTPDRSKTFEGIPRDKITTLPEIPMFTYPEIVDVVKK